jgi:hypothetical protein
VSGTRPSRAAAALALSLALVGCGGDAALPEGDLVFSVTADVEEARPGESFPVTVVRVWTKDLVPAAWDDRALAPLVLRADGVSLREDDARVEETRRYRAYAFTTGDVTVRPPPFAARPRDGGPDRKVEADGLRVRVTPTLDPADPGLPELPGEPLEEPFPWSAVLAIGGLLVAVGAVAATRLLRRRPAAVLTPPPAPSAPAADVADRALARLRTLRANAAADPAADVAAAAEVARAYVGERFDVPVLERTSPEILHDARRTATATPGDLELLSRVLIGGDLVKFATHRPTAPDRDAVLESAEAFVTRTAPAPPSGSAAP